MALRRARFLQSDFMLTFPKEASAAQLNDLLREATLGSCSRLIDWSNAPHALVDFKHDPHLAIVVGSRTRACRPCMVNLYVWFDNEWGFANRMVELACYWLEALVGQKTM